MLLSGECPQVSISPLSVVFRLLHVLDVRLIGVSIGVIYWPCDIGTVNALPHLVRGNHGDPCVDWSAPKGGRLLVVHEQG